MGKEDRIREIKKEEGVSHDRAAEIQWIEEQEAPGDTFTLDENGNLVPDDPGPDIRSRIKDDQ